VSIADPYSDHKFFEKNDSAAKKEMSEMWEKHTSNGTTQTCHVCYWRGIYWTSLRACWMPWKVYGLN